MDEDRLVRVMLALAATDGLASTKLCALSARVVAVSGAGITIMTADGATRMTVCYSDGVAQVIEDLQFSLGEGPCGDAYLGGRPVVEADLSQASPQRWPQFAPAALAAGVAAVFGFPLRAGGLMLGAIDLYRDRPGALSDEQFEDALTIADVVAREILVMQEGALDGSVATALMVEPGLRLVVHQATGMVAAQLDVDVREAIVRLRARAFADGLALTSVATAVVERRLRFDGGVDRSRPSSPGRPEPRGPAAPGRPDKSR